MASGKGIGVFALDTHIEMREAILLLSLYTWDVYVRFV